MSKNIERIDHYLRNVDLPEPAPGPHRHELRRQVLDDIERKQTMSARIINWRKTVAIALIGSGIVAAAVVGVKVRKYYFVSKHPEYGYMLRSEDGQITTNIPERWADSPDEAVEVREELALLKQQNEKELTGVREIEVNGQLDSRGLTYTYTLSNGRKAREREDDPETGPGTLVGERKKEARRRWHEILAGSMAVSSPDGGHRFVNAAGEEIPTYERVVQGRAFTFTKYVFTLSDGTEVTWSMGKLKDDE